MTPRISGYAFVLVTVVLYTIFAAPLVGLPLDGLAFIAFSALYLFGVLGLALDLSELIFAAIFPVRSHPIAAGVVLNRAHVAVLYLCRDDVDKEALQQLEGFREVDVFILDDSESAAARSLVDASGFNVVRRADRQGFKAGNLNHWLRLCGDKYRYSLVLDSDSTVTNDALLQLVAYAEHPANSDVGIVQASILPRAGNHFQTNIGAFASLRCAVLLRVHAWIGCSLSQGHNNLHRIAALKEIGGFDTAASCEDTLTSLRMRNFGWRTIVVDTITFDAEPRNAFAHRRRSVRWARQTLDAILARQGGSDPLLSLLLARHLYSYLLAAVWPFMLIPFSVISIQTHQCCFLEPGAEPSWLTVARLGAPLGLLTLVSLRILFWWRVNGTLRGFLTSSVLSGSVALFSSVEVFRGLIQSLLIRQTQFIPTGIVRKEPLGIVPLWNGMKLATLARAITISWILLAAGQGHLLLTTISTLPFIMTSPLILWWYHRDQRSVLP